MRLMQLCLLLAITSMAFTACDKDDNDSSGNKGGSDGNDIVGQWSLTKSEYNGDTEYYDEGEYMLIINENGRGIATGGKGDNETFLWEVGDNGRTFVMFFGDEAESYTVRELTSNRLVLEDREYPGWIDTYERLD